MQTLQDTAFTENARMTDADKKTSVLDYDATKTDAYFAGARLDWLAQLPVGKGLHILEIGCGHGGSGRYAQERNISASYTGVEIAEQAAAVARETLTEVLVGNVETMELPFAKNSFDVLMMSEVLEHLVDPWATLERLIPFLKPNALVFASSPNVAHKDIVKQLLLDRWDLADSGPMDRTHLRWFTQKTYAEMFERSGIRVEHVGPLDASIAFRHKVFSALTLKKFDHLFCYQINLRGRVA